MIGAERKVLQYSNRSFEHLSPFRAEWLPWLPQFDEYQVVQKGGMNMLIMKVPRFIHSTLLSHHTVKFYSNIDNIFQTQTEISLCLYMKHFDCLEKMNVWIIISGLLILGPKTVVNWSSSLKISISPRLGQIHIIMVIESAVVALFIAKSEKFTDFWYEEVSSSWLLLICSRFLSVGLLPLIPVRNPKMWIEFYIINMTT